MKKISFMFLGFASIFISSIVSNPDFLISNSQSSNDSEIETDLTFDDSNTESLESSFSENEFQVIDLTYGKGEIELTYNLYAEEVFIFLYQVAIPPNDFSGTYTSDDILLPQGENQTILLNEETVGMYVINDGTFRYEVRVGKKIKNPSTGEIIENRWDFLWIGDVSPVWKDDPILEINNIESYIDKKEIIVDYSYTPSSSSNEKAYIVVDEFNGPIVEYPGIPKEVSIGQNQSVVLDENDTWNNYELSEGNQYKITLYTENSISTNQFLVSEQFFFHGIDFTLNNIDLFPDGIEINYDLNYQENIRLGTDIKIWNKNSNDPPHWIISNDIPVGNNQTLALNNNSPWFWTPFFFPNETYVFQVSSVGTDEDGLIFVEEEITLPSINPALILNDVQEGTNNIEIEYTYEQGFPTNNEKAYLDVENKTISQKVERIELNPGNHKITLNNETMPNIFFNPGDEFEIILYTEDSVGNNIFVTEDIILDDTIISPILGLEVNYDNIYDPTQLSLRLQYVEQNDAESINSTISFYYSNGVVQTENLNINEGEKFSDKIIVDIDQYSANLSDVQLSYTFKIDGGNANYKQSEPINVKNITGNIIDNQSPTNTWSIWFWILLGGAIFLILIFSFVPIYIFFNKNKLKKNTSTKSKKEKLNGNEDMLVQREESFNIQENNDFGNLQTETYGTKTQNKKSFYGEENFDSLDSFHEL